MDSVKYSLIPASSPTEQLCMDLIELMTVFTNTSYGDAK